MQIIDQVSKENAKLKEDYVEIEGLLSEARNEISSLQEQLLSEQEAAATATVNVSQEIEAYNQSNPVTTTSIEIQTDPSPKSRKKLDKGTQCNIINVITKRKPISTKINTHTPSPTRSVSSTSSIDTGKKNATKKKIKGNKVITGKDETKDYYYISPASTRFNSSYSIEGRPRWNLWKLR